MQNHTTVGAALAAKIKIIAAKAAPTLHKPYKTNKFAIIDGFHCVLPILQNQTIHKTNRRMGRATRNPSTVANTATDGATFAILRD